MQRILSDLRGRGQAWRFSTGDVVAVTASYTVPDNCSTLFFRLCELPPRAIRLFPRGKDPPLGRGFPCDSIGIVCGQDAVPLRLSDLCHDVVIPAGTPDEHRDAALQKFLLAQFEDDSPSVRDGREGGQRRVPCVAPSVVSCAGVVVCARGQDAERLLQLNLYNCMQRNLPLRACKGQKVSATALCTPGMFFGCLQHKVEKWKEYGKTLGPWRAWDFPSDTDFGIRVLLHLTGQKDLPARLSREGVRILWAYVTQVAFNREKSQVRVRGLVELA